MCSKTRNFILIFLFILSSLISVEPVYCETAGKEAKAQKIERPEKLAVLFPQSMSLVYLLGLGENLTGIPAAKIKVDLSNAKGFLNTFSSGIMKAADVGYPGEPNIETILRIKPDMVFSAVHFAKVVNVNKILTNAGIKVLGLRAGYGSLDEWLKTVKESGSVTHCESKAKAYLDFWNSQLTIVKSRISNIPLEKRPKAVIIGMSDGQIVVNGFRSAFSNDLLMTAGARILPMSGNSKQASADKETLFTFDPDILFADIRSGAENFSWLQELNAVRKRAAYYIPLDDNKVWFTNWISNLYAPVGLVWMAKKLYPDLFEDVNLKKVHDDFCIKVLGKDFDHMGSGYK